MSASTSEPTTEEEWYEEALAMLRRLGVSNPEVGESGSIPVNPINQKEVVSVQITESTSTRQRVLNQFPRDPEERVLVGGPKFTDSYGSLACNLLNCRGILPLRECSYVETSWTDPEIIADSLPNRIPEATAYLNPFNARIEGDVEYELGNSSEPGEKHTQTIYKCKQNGPKETEVIEDSAVIDSLSDTEFIDVDAEETLDNVQHSVEEITPDASATAEVEFEKEGALTVLESLFNAWTNGYMRAEADGTLTVNYEWRGSQKTKEFNVNTEVRIPVTEINYGW